MSRKYGADAFQCRYARGRWNRSGGCSCSFHPIGEDSSRFVCFGKTAANPSISSLYHVGRCWMSSRGSSCVIWLSLFGVEANFPPDKNRLVGQDNIDTPNNHQKIETGGTLPPWTWPMAVTATQVQERPKAENPRRRAPFYLRFAQRRSQPKASQDDVQMTPEEVGDITSIPQFWVLLGFACGRSADLMKLSGEHGATAARCRRKSQQRWPVNKKSFTSNCCGGATGWSWNMGET